MSGAVDDPLLEKAAAFCIAQDGTGVGMPGGIAILHHRLEFATRSSTVDDLAAIARMYRRISIAMKDDSRDPIG